MKKLSLRARALNYLSRRELSRAELAHKLAPYAESAEELENLLQEFSDRNWQSDERYTESYMASRSKKYGSRRLTEALKNKGVAPELIRNHQIDKAVEVENALAVLQKKFTHLPQSAEEKNKQMRFLAYRGFDFDIIHQAFSLWKEAQDNLPEDADLR